MRNPRLAASLLVLILPGFAVAQSVGSGVDVVSAIISVDVEHRTLTLNTGQGMVVRLADEARILDAQGNSLPGGFGSSALRDGTVVTLTVGQVNGEPVISALRIGRHIPEQQAIRGPTLGLKPLTEMLATEDYKGEDGGLYGGGTNEPPASHLAAARAASQRIIPLDADGEPASDGVIGYVSISMSNATMEFSLFKELADRDERKSGRVAIVDCAQNGQAMRQWVDPEAGAWLEADHRLDEAMVSSKQVQVAWVKLANMVPTGDLAYHGRNLYEDTVAVLQNAKRRFPNLRIAYLGSRIYAGFSEGELNPEPYAYEGAFVVRWLIRDQIDGADPLRYDDGAGSAKVPLLLWGPYLWSDGTTPRGDGLTWERSDLLADGVHPSDTGRRKVADLLLEFFTTNALAKSWFTEQQDPARTVRARVQAHPGGPVEDVEMRVREVPVDPGSVPAGEADLGDDELVLGLVIEGQPIAYPVRYLAMYEVVNDRVGDTPLAPTW